MTKAEFDKKWGNINIDDLTDEQFVEFKNDCFDMYEESGFAEVFNSPYDDEGEHNGMTFEVVRRATADECDIEAMPIWLVKFENGDTAYCYSEEICKIEQRGSLSVDDAQVQLLNSIDKEDFGDRVYEFAQNLFQSGINVIETKNIIRDSDGRLADYEHSNEVMWYDDVQEEFFQKVYDKTLEFLSQR